MKVHKSKYMRKHSSYLFCGTQVRKFTKVNEYTQVLTGSAQLHKY